MAVSIEINDEFFQAAKSQADERGIDIRRVIEEALGQHLRVVRRAEPYVLQWRTETGRRLLGVDPADRQAISTLMDSSKDEP